MIDHYHNNPMEVSPKQAKKTLLSFHPSKSEGKLQTKTSNSSLRSLLPGKKIKTQAEIREGIRVNRVSSYRKLSFSIRKMDQLFHPKLQQTSKEKEEGSQKKYRVKDKNKCMHELNPRLNTCVGFDLGESAKKKTLLSRGELLEHMPLSKSESPVKHSPLRSRMRTEYCDKRDLILKQDLKLQHQLQQQLIYPKPIPIPHLASYQQEQILVRRTGIPGVTFKEKKREKQEEEPRQQKVKGTKKRTGHKYSRSVASHVQTSYLHEEELLESDDSESISQLYRLRSDKELRSRPKQWHLYNCLQLNQLSLYRTNLKLSCESWVLIDHLQLKYLRGWHPKAKLQLSLLAPLLLSKIFLKLSNTFPLRQVRIRINNAAVRSRMEQSSAVLADRHFSLKNNTIISLWDLCAGMLLTSKQDLTWHLLYSLSHLFKHCNVEQEELRQNHPQLFLDPISLETDKQQLKTLQEIFILKSSQIFEELKLVDTSVELRKTSVAVVRNQREIWGESNDHCVYKQTNAYHYLHCTSTCLEGAILFMDLLSCPSFFQLFQPKPYKCTIRYQVGYNFWQTRSHTFHPHCPQLNSTPNSFLPFSLKNQNKHNYAIVAYHPKDKAIIVCNECKVNMSLGDIVAVRRWMRETFVRFSSKKNGIEL